MDASLILVVEDANRKAWISCNDAEYLRARQNVAEEFAQTLSAAGAQAATALKQK